MGTATRTVYWHIEHVWIMYLLLVPTFVLFAYGIWRRYRLWSTLGKPVNRLDRPGERVRRLLAFALGGLRLFRETVAGWMHALIFWSMGLLFLGTVVVAIHTDLRIPIMQGYFYLVFQKLTLNIAGLLLLVGSAIALVRRYVVKVPRLQPNRDGLRGDPTDGVSLAALLLLMAQGFALQAIRLAARPDPYAAWSPVGYALSMLLRGVSPDGLIGAYQFVWWFHMVTTLSWIAWLPYGKMLHLITGPAAVYTANLEPPALSTLTTIDFDTAERLGASALTDFTWKDLLDLDACTSCGRCQAVCPAYAAGRPLSPRNLILDLRDHMSRGGDQQMVGGVIREETLWACTTCRACMEECPVFVEHVPKIIEMRRHLVMEEASLPTTLADALRSLEDRSHPYKGANASRTDWCEGLDVPLAADVEGDIDVLYWVGCTAAFDPRGQKVARAFAQLLTAAGVKFAILGSEEACCGDPARRIGNEFLYDGIARQNIDVLNQYHPKRIVTACPHCLTALGSEYKQFGGDFTVLHHTQLLKELVDGGRLSPAGGRPGTVTYHDPCYLGRWGGEYEAPRELIGRSVESSVEMERSRSKSFCCGAGGGGAFMEAKGETLRINQIRAAEAAATGAETLAVACPACMQMMEDGVKSLPDGTEMQVRDVAELLLEAMEETTPK